MIFRRKDRSLQRFYESLTPSKVGMLGYTKKDRYRDFQAVFGTPEGKKVLAQIIAQAEGLPILENECTDHAKMAYRAGMKYMGYWIVQTLNAEPLEEK